MSARKPAPPPQTPAAVTPEQRETLAREILLALSSFSDEMTPDWPAPWPESGKPGFGEHYGNHFTWAGSQVNTGLAAVAQLEHEGVIMWRMVSQPKANFRPRGSPRRRRVCW